MFHNHYNNELTETASNDIMPELLACRACLATDTKLYRLQGTLKETYEYLMGVQHICNCCGTVLIKYKTFKDRCVTAKRLMEDALQLRYPLTTALVQRVDRVSNNLLLNFSLGIDTKIIHITHEDDRNDSNDDNSDTRPESDKNEEMETDGLTDVLNDFEEITKTLNDDIHLSDNDFDDINGSPFIERGKNFNVEELFKGKAMNSELSDIITRAFTGKGKAIKKGISTTNIKKGKRNQKGDKKTIGDDADSESDIAKKTMNDDTNSTFCDAEEALDANLNGNLTPDITLNDVSINTTDLNDTDSNLVETFNNFILDHDYVDEKFLLETGDPDFMNRNVISKKTDEESLLKEILPKMTKKDKKLLLKEIEAPDKREKIRKPIKNLSKLKELNKRSKLKLKTDEIFKELSASQLETDNSLNDDTASKPIVIKPELPIDDNVKTELSKEFIKFGSDFNFRVFQLTRDEQLEELQKKREGALYLGSPYKCEDCARGFRSVSTYSNHLKVHEPIYGAFICEICNWRHKTDGKRRRHQQLHQFKYCCTKCEFVARSREKAESHYQWHKGKTYECQYCGEAFGRRSTQLSHVRLRHGGACAACARCGEPCVGRRGLLLHHRRSHADVTGPARPCAQGGDSFETDEALLQHRRGNHSDAPVQADRAPGVHPAPPPPPPRRAAPRTEKRHMCELCGKNYHSAAALCYHQRVHSGERPFACPRCPSSFAHNHSLQAHLRTHTGERPFRCSQCARAFTTNHNLARHKRTVHLGQKQYSRCPLCLKWFSSASAAAMHVATAHERRPWPRGRRPGAVRVARER